MKELSILHIILIYLVTINVITFFVFGIDKWKAKRSKMRIREAALLMLAILGGSIGAWLGMQVWHHKTMHKKFKYGIPLILIVQIALLILTSCKTKQAIVEVPVPKQVVHKEIQEHSPDVFLVTYDENVGKQPLLDAIKEYGVEIKYDYKIINGMALVKPTNKTLEETMQYFRNVKGVKTVEYDHIIRLTDPVKPRLEVK
jgi:uncharacterized membrane protein YsdA (DUF1294 family)